MMTDCTNSPLLVHLNNIPTYYINLDSAEHRRDQFLSLFTCIHHQLHRISGVNGSDPDDVQKYLLNDVHTLPGVIDSLPNGLWDGIQHVPQVESYNKIFRGSLGCTLAHLKAALEIFRAGHDYALVLEDDASPELADMWYGTIPGWIESLHPGWSALQLSAVGSLFYWTGRFSQAENYTDRQVITFGNWDSSTIAYLISKKGANELIESFYSHQYDKFNLSLLKCINADMCLSRFLQEKATKLPPMFIPHLRSDDSFIVSEQPGAISKQFDLIEISRIFAKHWYRMYRPPWTRQ